MCAPLNCSVLPSIHKACRPNKPSVWTFLLIWEWEECNSFDVAIGSTQILPSHHALKFTWGEHWTVMYYMYVVRVNHPPTNPPSQPTCICSRVATQDAKTSGRSFKPLFRDLFTQSISYHVHQSCTCRFFTRQSPSLWESSQLYTVKARMECAAPFNIATSS